MATIFSRPGWAEDTSRHIQGAWLRFCVERPCPTHQWVAVLDNACLLLPQKHAAQNGILAAQHIMSITPFLHFNQIALHDFETEDWETTPPASQGAHMAADLSPFAQHWVGRHAQKGWPTDTVLSAHTFHLGTQWQPPSLQGVVPLLQVLHSNGCPHGMGWALPTPQSAREPERHPAQASTHQHLQTRRLHGPPQPWDARTARITVAVMAYVRHTGPRGPFAWND